MTALDTSPAPGAPQVFPPTLREVMLRPWWIGMLLIALAVAAVFAWLGQWQLGNALRNDAPPPGATEQVRPLTEITTPGAYLPEPLVGQRVETEGTWHPDDFLVVSSRVNGGVEGYWVTGRFDVSDAGAGTPALLAVAVGWTATRAEADAAVSDLRAGGQSVTLTGRLISDEGPALPPAGAPPTEMTRMSPTALLGRWHAVEGMDVYRSYLVADLDTIGMPSAGLIAIDSPAPTEGTQVHWLNIFYAIEWAVFAGFAFYMWYRLAKDAWEKEVEALTDAATGPPAPVAGE